MELDLRTLTDFDGETATPSPNFINAISEFLDTDPNDLLMELGYYDTPTSKQDLLRDPATAGV